MPKSLTIHPGEVRKSGRIALKAIPVNAYDGSFDDEVQKRGAEALTRIGRDMELIRAFETMLNDVKLNGTFDGVPYNHRGPAHLSIGQEAAAVGQAFALGVQDHIFGSHRSHGEILAKGLSAILAMEEAHLTAVMESWLDGATLRAVDDGTHASVRELAIDFLVYGALAEIFGRATGFNRGMGGSMHAFFPPFGVYPNNALVGGSADISVGAALFKRVNGEAGMVVCNIGDAAASCGPTWEALCFATMDQFRTLWPKPHRGGLPLVMNFVNNFYGMGGQPVGETGGFGVLARMGAGLAPGQMHAERIDGYNPLAVIDAMERKRAAIEAGDGPILLDTVTYRYSGHSPSDASSYRERAEIDEWRSVDSIDWWNAQLVASGVATEDAIEATREGVAAVIRRAYHRAIDPDRSPRENLFAPGCLLERTMYSNETAGNLAPDRAPELLAATDENPRVRQNAVKSRTGIGDDGEPLPKGKCISVRDALFEAVLHAFETDATLVAYGEENRDWGGAFAVYRGLTEALPYHRLFNSPIAEAAIVGSAVGYALEGGRALVELMYCDFLGRAGDEVFNQLAKWQSMSGGTLRMPVVLRVSVGSKYGAQHSQDWTALCAHIPGLKVLFPATPYDAKGLLAAALEGTDPVVFFESQRTYDQPEIFHAGGVPEGHYTLPLGVPDVKRQGSDVTILTVGATLYRAIEAAERLQADFGISAEVIDARSIVPFDFGPVLDSVARTGKILLASDACARGSVLQTFAAQLTELAFDDLDAPPIVLGARNWITPPDEIEESFFPFPSDFLDAIHEHLLPLDGYVPRQAVTRDVLLERARAGV